MSLLNKVCWLISLCCSNLLPSTLHAQLSHHFPVARSGSAANPAKTLTVFSQVNVVDVETGRVRPNRDVLVSNGRIIAIRQHAAAGLPKRKKVRLIPAKGKYLLPGLIDCHTHIMYQADLGAYLRNGVTTVFSLGQPQEILSVREKIKQGTVLGPTIYAAALLDTVAYDWQGKVYSYVVHAPTEVATAMAHIKKQGYDLLKVYNNLTTPEFDEIMRLAKVYRLPVVGHGVRQPGMAHILAKGLALVAHGEEYLYTIFKDSLDESKIPAAAALTTRYGAFVCPNLSTFHNLLTQWGDSLRFAGLLAQTDQVKRRVSPHMLQFWLHENHYIHRAGSPLVPMYPFLQKLTYAFYQAGVPLVAGTDSPVIPGCFPGYSLVSELQLLTEAGLSTTAAVRTATLVPGRFVAQYLPDNPKIGRINIGYAADLVLLAANPLQSVQHLRRIEGVMANGRWYSAARLARFTGN